MNALNLLMIADKSKYQAIKEYQEILWKKLLGLDNLSGKITSPLRQDDNPGCFFWNTGKWIYFVDFADYPTHRNIIDFVKEYFSYSFEQAVDFLYQLLLEERNVLLKPLNRKVNIDKGKRKIFLYAKQTEKYQKHYNYFKQFGIDLNEIESDYAKNFRIIPLQEFIAGKYKVKDLAFKYEFNKNEYKIYAPHQKKFKWRSQVSKNTIGWIHHNYTYNKYKKQIIITKSIKDALILAETKIPVLIFQSETSFPDFNILANYLKYSNTIHIVFDNDETGIKQAKKLKNKLFFEFSNRINILTPPVKDVADFAYKYGKNTVLYWLHKKIWYEHKKSNN